MEHDASLLNIFRGITLQNRQIGTIYSIHSSPQHPSEMQITVHMSDDSLYRESIPHSDVVAFNLHSGEPVQVVRRSIVGDYLDILATHTSLENHPSLRSAN